MLRRISLTLMATLAAVTALAEPEFAQKPVNPLFIKAMSAKPWWDAAYKSRAPLLVTEPIGKSRGRTTLDFICDFGSEVNPASIRVVTPWEEEIPCQAIGLEGGRIEVLFQTSLREDENKPFFVYFDNPEAKPPDADTDLVMKDKGMNLEITNEKIQALFTADNTRSGKIRSLRIIGSDTPNQLMEMKTGVTWAGFDLGKIELSTKPMVKTDGPFKKTIEYTAKELAIEYTVYSFSPRVDFKIKPQTAKTVNTVTKWAVGGGDAYDTFYYEGLKGPMRFKAGPDCLSDKNDVYPNENLTKWMREGWAAVSDIKTNETVGECFDRDAMAYFNYYSQTINGGETFSINYNLKKPVAGALVAVKGDGKEFRNAYIDWKNPPVVSVGSVQPHQNIGHQRSDFTKDFTRDFKFENGREGTQVTADFAEHIIRHIRRLGGNAAKFNFYSYFPSLPLSKQQYDTFVKLHKKYSAYPTQFAPYDKSIAENTYLEALVKAAHAQGVAVRYWDQRWGWKQPMDDPEYADFLVSVYKTMAKTGVDLIQNGYVGGEWADVPPELGSVWDTFWEKPDAWFAAQKPVNDFAKHLYGEIKKEYPNMPVNTLCSADGWLRKETFMDEKAPYLDTVENEFVPGMIPNMPLLKYGIKRMHGIFGNDGRSIQHHFYYYEPNPLYRVSQMEVPMMFGVKSFSHENMSHSQNNPELDEITADFYRLTDYTELDKFVAGSIPHKFMAVFRDSNAFKDDIRNKRISLAFSQEQGEQDARCKQLTVIKNMPLDVVYNRFFKAAELMKYKLLFIPSDRVFCDSDAKELEEYVQAGGCVISEGNTVDNKLFAKLAGVRKTGDVGAAVSVVTEGANILLKDAKGNPAVYLNHVGKGKVAYSPSILTDDLNNSREKELFVRKLIVDLVGTGPIVPEEKMVTAFDSSLLVNGDECFLGVYNPSSTKALRTEIKLDFPFPPACFLLNVKTGERAPFNGTVRTDIAPYQTGFYIVGTDKTTALPALKNAPLAGGRATETGMKFIDKKTDGAPFEFTPAGKPKTLGVLHITDRRGRQDQAYGAEAIYACLKKNLVGVKVQYLENLDYKTINGCDAVIVPNMGGDIPYQLGDKWWEKIAEFARQGGGAMVIHHAIGVQNVGEPPFPSIGKWSGNYYAVHDFSVAKEHPVTEGMKLGEVFHDSCWDYDQVQPGEDGTVLAMGLRKDGVPTPALVAGQVGKGNVVVSGIGIGSGGRQEKDKYVKYEAAPEGGLEKILLNAARWLLKEGDAGK